MGKNIIVGQSGGPTAVINSSLAGVFQSAKDRGVEKIYGMVNGIQGLLKDEYVDLKEHINSSLHIELLKRTPSSYLGSCRYRLKNAEDSTDEYVKLFEIFEKLDIGAFFYIGGNDSMDTINKLYNYGKTVNSDIKFIGIPKTIDNDLMLTDHTPGFGSAAKYIGAMTKEIIRDGLVYGTKQVTILEVMGRNAGWLTGATALSKGDDCEGIDLIYIPEVPFDVEEFIAKVDKLQQEKLSVVVAVSEGVKTADGTYVSELTDNEQFVDAFGHKSLTGTSRYLANLCARRIGCKTRAIEFSTLQRCASHLSSRVDVTEAYQVGGAGVKAAMEGISGKMVTLVRISNDPYQCTTGLVDIGQIANFEKTVPIEWLNETKDYVTQDFLSYVKPLIQAELTPIMVDGLPQHLYLRRK
ncbi:MAG: 6-phosphofructokinase [Bacillota bacterium]